MKELLNKIIDAKRTIAQSLFIIIAYFVALLSYDKIYNLLKDVDVDFDNWIYHSFIRLPKYIFGIAVSIVLFLYFRKLNTKVTVNKGNRYHNHSYLYYWCCSKIFGHQKIDLKLVPIYMQFKLVINSVYNKFYTGEDTDYRTVDSEEISVQYVNKKKKYSNEINIILIDTYSITENQLPPEKMILTTIYVSRKLVDRVRSYSPEFISRITNVVRSLPNNVKKINIYATTNPKHTELISRNVFQLGNRDNIDSLVVFQQSKKAGRNFYKGYKVY